MHTFKERINSDHKRKIDPQDTGKFRTIQGKDISIKLNGRIKTFPKIWWIFFSKTEICIKDPEIIIWTASSEFGTYSLCEQRRFRRACAFAQSRQNLRCSLIQAVSQEEPLDRKPDRWPLWMAGHAQLKFVMTECSKTQVCLMGLIWAEVW